MEMFTTALGLIVVNLVLSGDNAVIIGMAAYRLHGRQRLFAIIFGGVMAVVLRVIFTFIAVYLLAIPALQFVGGVLLIWIAFKLLSQEIGGEGEHKEAGSMWEAIWIITVADVVMSLDNVLAIAGVSGGNMTALIIGLGMSMPLVLFCGGIIANLIERYPWINLVGAVAIAYVAGEMMLEDKLVGHYIPRFLEEAHVQVAIVPIVIAIAVPIISGVMKSRAKKAKPEVAHASATPSLES